MKYLMILTFACLLLVTAETAQAACTSYEDFGAGLLTLGKVEAITLASVGSDYVGTLRQAITVHLSEGYRNGEYVSCVQFQADMNDSHRDHEMMRLLQMAMTLGYNISTDVETSSYANWVYAPLTISK